VTGNAQPFYDSNRPRVGQKYHEGTRLISRIKLVTKMIGMSLQDGECPIKLFEQDYARQFMRKRHLTKGEHQSGSLPGLVAEAIRGTDREQQGQRIAILIVSEKLCQFF